MSRRRWLIFGLCAAAYFLSQFFRSTNAVLARDLSAELSLGAAQLGLMTSLFYLSFAGVQLPLGSALDRFGARLVTPLLMLVAVAGTLLFAAAHSFAMLALGRMLMGLGMAGVFMGSLKLFSRWFSSTRYASASCYLVAFGSLGALTAGSPLAKFNEALGWRLLFVVGAGLIFLSAASLLLWTRDSPIGKSRVHNVGAARGLGSILGSLAFWRLACLDFFLVGSFLSFQGLWGGPFLLDVVGLSNVQAGTFLTLLSLGALVGYVTSGSLADRFGHRRVVFIGGILFVFVQAGLVLLALAPRVGLIAPIMASLGFFAAVNIVLKAQALTAFPLELSGRAVTAVNLFGIGGAFLVQWLQGVVIDAFGRAAGGHYPPEAYAAAFALSAAGCLAALLFYSSSSLARGALRLQRVLVWR